MTPLEIVAQPFVFPETRYVIAVGAVSSMLGVLITWCSDYRELCWRWGAEETFQAALRN